MDIMDIAVAKALSGGGGGGGGGGSLVFHVDASHYPELSIDKTFAELYSAYENGIDVVGLLENQIVSRIHRLYYIDYDQDGPQTMYFMNFGLEGDDETPILQASRISVFKDENVSYREYGSSN